MSENKEVLLKILTDEDVLQEHRSQLKQFTKAKAETV